MCYVYLCPNAKSGHGYLITIVTGTGDLQENRSHSDLHCYEAIVYREKAICLSEKHLLLLHQLCLKESYILYGNLCHGDLMVESKFICVEIMPPPSHKVMF